MSDLLRETALGQVIRYVTKNKVLLYAEEKPDFSCPHDYRHGSSGEKSPVDSAEEAGRPAPEREETEDSVALQKAETQHSVSSHSSMKNNLGRADTRVDLEKLATRSELEQAYSRATLPRTPTRPIVPEKLDDGTILVDWYDTDDPDNPQNWSPWKKHFTSLTIGLYTFAVYMGSAIYTPSIPGVVEVFGVTSTVASLGLALYVLGYGTGPLLFAPLSEIPVVGRNPPYVATFAIFTILCVPTALADNIGGLLFLRFLQGFFGSPCLATAGASFGDMYSLVKLPYAIALWAACATCGPALGPIISGFSVPAQGWRWSLWEILWCSGPIFIMMFVGLPETSSPNILIRRAKRLRKLTGNPNIKSQSEINETNMNATEIVIDYLYKPFQMMFLDPAVGFTDFYTSLVYGIYYSFFEAFPIVYIEGYGFNFGEMGLTFLCITVATGIAIPSYVAYLYWVVEPDMKKNGLGAPEKRLIPALFTCLLIPVGLFMFAWTARTNIHWIVSIIGVGIYTIGVFIVLQCIFVYIPLTYPQYAASLFAGNDFARSAVAFAAILFATPMFKNLGVGPAVSLLAAFTVVCIAGVYALYFLGPWLRSRSRFTIK
ncbi:MAG: hypothetical protein M1825_002630 [Sarcosagium campestre]|nr:MAG: hypothetical protein M1825_002630 [Sarcosagium campestre]